MCCCHEPRTACSMEQQNAINMKRPTHAYVLLQIQLICQHPRDMMAIKRACGASVRSFTFDGGRVRARQLRQDCAIGDARSGWACVMISVQSILVWRVVLGCVMDVFTSIVFFT